MAAFIRKQVFKSFSEYPLTKEFEKRLIGVWILSTSIIVLAALAVFNLLTQGHDNISSTAVLQTFYSAAEPLKNGSSTTTCQSSLLDISAGYYTRTPSNIHNNTGVNAVVNPGSFQWTINAFNPDGHLDTVQGEYNGEELDCYATSIGLTYYFSGNNYLYGICAKCSLVNRQNNTFGDDSIIEILDLCTHYDSIRDNWPSFTQYTQQNISAINTLIQGTYANLTFTTGELPPEIFPTGFNSTEKSISITPDLVDFANFWLGGISYYKEPVATECHNSIYCSTGSYRLHNGSTYDDIRLLLNITGGDWESGSVLPVLGIGQLQPNLAFNGDVSQLPGVLPDLYEILFASAGYMFDAAVQDLQGRSLASSFICTVQTTKWKSPLSLFAVVIGNSFSVWSIILTLMITLGSTLDQRYRAKNSTPVSLLPVSNQISSPSSIPALEKDSSRPDSHISESGPATPLTPNIQQVQGPLSSATSLTASSATVALPNNPAGTGSVSPSPRTESIHGSPSQSPSLLDEEGQHSPQKL